MTFPVWRPFARGAGDSHIARLENVLDNLCTDSEVEESDDDEEVEVEVVLVDSSDEEEDQGEEQAEDEDGEGPGRGPRIFSKMSPGSRTVRGLIPTEISYIYTFFARVIHPCTTIMFTYTDWNALYEREKHVPLV